MQYLFTAIYTTNSTGTVDVSFPDLPGCYTQGLNMTDAAKKAEAVLCLCLFEMEQYGKAIPSPQLIDEIPITDTQTSSIVMTSTDMYHAHFSGKTESYDIDIPLWMSQLAKASNLSIAFLLENAIRSHVGLPIFDTQPMRITQEVEQVDIVAEPKPTVPIVDAPPQPLDAMESYRRKVLGITEESLEREPPKDRHKPKYAATSAAHLPEEIHFPVPVEDILSEESPYKVPAQAENQPSRLQRAHGYIFSAILMILTLVGAYFILFTNFPQNLRIAVTARIQAAQDDNHQTDPVAAEEANIITPPERNISEILQENFGNENMFAQIGILGTSINEPVLRDIGSDFYHTHNMRNIPSEYGAVFMKVGDISPGASGNIVIYGGFPSAGGQFSTLYRFLNPDFFAENNSITLITDYGPMQWQIFSFYVDYSDFDYDTETSPRNNARFLQNSMHETDIVVTEDDRVITLITEFETGARYVLHGKSR